MTNKVTVGTPIFDELLRELRMTWRPGDSAPTCDAGVMTGVLVDVQAEAVEASGPSDSLLVGA